MIYTLISILLCLFFIPIVLKRFGFLNLHNLYLLYLCLLFTYIAILLTFLLLHMYSPNPSNLFYLFNFDSIFSMLHLPIEEKVKTAVQVPITNDISEHLILFNKNLNVLTQKVDLLLDKYTLNNQMIETLLKQNQVMHNNSAEKLALVVQNTANLKSGFSVLQSSIDVGFKNINIFLSTFNDRSQEIRDVLSYVSNIQAKNLESLQVLNNQFLVSSAELNKINSVLNAQTEISSNGFTALHKALETSVSAQTDLQSQIDLIKQRQTDLNYKNYVENQKLSKELESFKVETRSEIEANKPKVMVTEAKVSSSWFNSLFSSDKK